MSGHSVIIMPMVNPAALLPVGLAAGAATLGVGLAAGVKAIVESRIAAAQREREREKAANQAWRAYEKEQREKSSLFKVFERAVQASEQSLASLQLAVAGTKRRETGEIHPAAPHDYAAVGAERDPEKMDRMIAEMELLLKNLPAEFRSDEASSFPALLRQAQRLTSNWQAGRKVRPAEIVAFKDFVAGSLKEFASDVVARDRQRRLLAERLGKTLDTVMFYEQILRQHQGFLPGQFPADVASLRDQLTRLLTAEDLRLGQLELIEKKLADLRVAIDAEVIQLAQRDGLCESMMRNLNDMGYKVLTEFGNEPAEGIRDAVFRVPGGERVHITLHKNNQIGMQLLHERKKSKAGPISKKELDHIRTQETRWCSDFKELVRRLVAEGFPYQISLEEEVPESAVKVVVVETPEDVLAQDAEQAMQYDDTPQRYLDQT